MNDVYINIFFFFLWILFSFYEGQREAYYYHSASKTNDLSKYNIHYLYSIQRALFLLMVLIHMKFSATSIITILSYMFCFPFIHDSAYYNKRNDLDKEIYPKRWKDDSTTSTAVIEVKFKHRIIFFILGTVSFIIFNIILKWH